MERLVEVRALPGFRLWLRYDDGAEGTVEIAPRMRGPMFEPLRDAAYFALVELGAGGAPTWPNGLDLAPDALYERLMANASKGAA